MQLGGQSQLGDWEIGSPQLLHHPGWAGVWLIHFELESGDRPDPQPGNFQNFTLDGFCSFYIILALI